MSKIIVYTINNCPFCEQEKAYLNEHTLLFEEKNVDTNRAYLSEMLAVSDNFTGVPFTIIQKDDGSKVSLKGFTKEEFDTALGITAVPPVAPTVEVSTPSVLTSNPEDSIKTPSSGQSEGVSQPESSPTSPQETVLSPPTDSVGSMPISQPSVSPVQPVSQPSSPQEKVQDQKLQDILSNLQKISGMNSQPEESLSTKPTHESVVSIPPLSAPEPIASSPTPSSSSPVSESPKTDNESLSSQTPSVPSPFYQPLAPHVENTEPLVPSASAQPQPTVSESVPPTSPPPSVDSQPVPNPTSPPPIPDFPK